MCAAAFNSSGSTVFQNIYYLVVIFWAPIQIKMFVEIALLLLVALLYLLMKDRKPPNMPPGPIDIPFFGRMPVFLEESIEKLWRAYGDIVTIRTGNIRSIMIYDYKVAKEAMARPEFTGRPAFFSEFSVDEQKTGGLFGSNGLQWQHDRRFSLRNLRNLGMGKSYLEEAINTEARALVEDLKMYEGKAIKYPDSFRTVALNIIWQMVASRRYDLRSKEVDVIYALTKEFQSQSIILFLPSFVPALNYLPKPLRNLLFKEYIFDAFIKAMTELLNATIKDHEEDVDMENPRDLIDEYLRDMNFMKDQENDQDSFFRIGALRQIINDLFGAGSDPINGMLKWVAYLLARYPEIAKRLQQEIDEVVPRNELVSLDHKPHLPLVEAFTVETLRFSSMVLLNVQRTAFKDTTIEGYFVPKGSFIVACNYVIHHHPKYWQNPRKFSPDRFIDENGRFQAPKEGFFAFGSGRRQCVGELLARMELFLFSAAMIQNFDIKVPEGAPLRVDIENRLGFRLPWDTSLIYQPRA